MKTIWTREQLIAAYPALVEFPRTLGLRARHISPSDVPVEFRELIPYAELLGVGDDGSRDNLVDGAPTPLLENLVKTMAERDDRLDQWLAGPEAAGPVFTEAYVAFSCLRMAADYAAGRLQGLPKVSRE